MKILFFDGYCVLCNRLVDWLIRRDQRTILKFASLQGSTAREVLPEPYKSKVDVDTILYFRNGIVHDRSRAVLLALWDVSPLWRWTVILFLIPKFILDLVYKFVVLIRYRVFGKRLECRVPEPEERQRLLP